MEKGKRRGHTGKVVKFSKVGIGDEQCGFRNGRMCILQIFWLKVSHKVLRKKYPFVALMELEKRCNNVDENGVRKVL